MKLTIRRQTSEIISSSITSERFFGSVPSKSKRQRDTAKVVVGFLTRGHVELLMHIFCTIYSGILSDN